MTDTTRGLVPPEGSYEDRLAQIAAAAAPALDVEQVDALRASLGPAFRGESPVAPVVELPVEPAREAPGRAA